MLVSFSYLSKFPENTLPSSGYADPRGGGARLLSRDRTPILPDPRDGCAVRIRNRGGEFVPARFLWHLHLRPANSGRALQPQTAPRRSDAPPAPIRNSWHSPNYKRFAEHPVTEPPLHGPARCNGRSIRSRVEASQDAASCHSLALRRA